MCHYEYYSNHQTSPFPEIEPLVVRMCDHGGTDVLNLSQNNLAPAPESPFALVISKMREVDTITNSLSPSIWLSLHWTFCLSPFIMITICLILIVQVNLTNAHLNPGQARSLLAQVADASSLSILKISENDLSSVPGSSF